MSKLIPCPFCGGLPKMYSLNDPTIHGFIHFCEGYDDFQVKIESRFFLTEEEAEDAWNRRTDTMEQHELSINGENAEKSSLKF